VLQANQLSDRLVTGHEIGGIDQTALARGFLGRQPIFVSDLGISAVRE
jgi:hypothetical protein